MVIWDTRPEELRSLSEKASSDQLVSLDQLVMLVTDLEYKTNGTEYKQLKPL